MRYGLQTKCSTEAEKVAVARQNISSLPASEAAWYIGQHDSFERHVQCIAALAMERVLVEEPDCLITKV